MSSVGASLRGWGGVGWGRCWGGSGASLSHRGVLETSAVVSNGVGGCVFGRVLSLTSTSAGVEGSVLFVYYHCYYLFTYSFILFLGVEGERLKVFHDFGDEA